MPEDLSTGPLPRADLLHPADAAEWRERTRRQQAAIVRIATSWQFSRASRLHGQRLLTEVAAEALGVERCSVWFLEEDGQTLHCHDLFERSTGTHSSGQELAADDYPAYFEALKSGRAVDAHDAVSDDRTREFSRGYLDALDIGSMLDAAIRVGGKIVGVVCFEHVAGKREWTPDELSFAGEAADQVANLDLAAQQREHIAERTALWNQLTKSERQRMIGTLAAGIAHDFNNILTPVMAHAELALLAVDPAHPVQEHLRPIVDAAEKARGIIHQLMVLGRPAEAMSEVSDLPSVAASALSLARASTPANVGLEASGPTDPLRVGLGPAQLEQILLNLIVNGVHAMRESGGVLRVDWARTTGDSGAPLARIRVIDEGHGMDEQTKARVFEPFFTTKATGEGTGLGLAVVHGILEGIGGRIEVESSPGRGSRFDVYLPVADAAADGLEAEDPPGDARRTRILLVDDELAVARVVQAQLQHLGHAVETATSSAEAWEVFESHAGEFDVVISDQSMPGMSGSELLKKIRDASGEVSTILMSGLHHEGEEHAGHVDMVLTKPLRIEQLRQAIAGLRASR